MAGPPLQPSSRVPECCAALVGVVAAVRGAAAPEWEVRNAANLCFAALVSRIVGYNNVRKVCMLSPAICCGLLRDLMYSPFPAEWRSVVSLPVAFCGSSRCA